MYNIWLPQYFYVYYLFIVKVQVIVYIELYGRFICQNVTYRLVFWFNFVKKIYLVEFSVYDVGLLSCVCYCFIVIHFVTLVTVLWYLVEKLSGKIDF